MGTSVESSLPFAMSGDTNVEDDIKIPVVFLFHREGRKLIQEVENDPNIIIRISGRCARPQFIFEKFLVYGDYACESPAPFPQCYEVDS